MNNPPEWLPSITDIDSLNQTNETCNTYRVIQASWLIKLTLVLNWAQHPSKKINRFTDPILLSSEFMEITGLDFELSFAGTDSELKIIHQGQIVEFSESYCRTVMKNRLIEINSIRVDSNCLMLRNIERLSSKLELSNAAKAILLFASMLYTFDDFREVINSQAQPISNEALIKVLASVLGHTQTDIRRELRPDAPLFAAGILEIYKDVVTLESKLTLLNSVANFISSTEIDIDEGLKGLIKEVRGSKLDLTNYSHLSTEISVISRYISNAVASKLSGINILIYGIPGTGKTEFVKVLSQQLGLKLFEVASADESGYPMTGKSRLRSYCFIQNILKHKGNSLLMFDEIEDVILSLNSNKDEIDSSIKHKAWFNKILENNQTPTFWITNDQFMDPAYLRRFDYSIQFKVPPEKARLEIAKQYIGKFNHHDGWLNKIVADDLISPAQLENAAKVINVIGEEDLSEARLIIENALEHSSKLLNNRTIPRQTPSFTKYDLGNINVDCDIAVILNGLAKHRSGSLCFYGPPGTGKSELARHIANEVDAPVMIRRASDILSMWVGESEKNIANMFTEANEEGAVLILDEIDSLLHDRRGTQNHWEVSQINELLVQMETFEGIFICTTNLMDMLDQASLRRFSFKIKFDYLNSDQCWNMFLTELGELGYSQIDLLRFENQMRSFSNLTPGDFSVVKRKLSLMQERVSPEVFIDQLRSEIKYKVSYQVKIGF